MCLVGLPDVDNSVHVYVPVDVHRDGLLHHLVYVDEHLLLHLLLEVNRPLQYLLYYGGLLDVHSSLDHHGLLDNPLHHFLHHLLDHPLHYLLDHHFYLLLFDTGHEQRHRRRVALQFTNLIPQALYLLLQLLSARDVLLLPILQVRLPASGIRGLLLVHVGVGPLLQVAVLRDLLLRLYDVSLCPGKLADEIVNPVMQESEGEVLAHLHIEHGADVKQPLHEVGQLYVG